MSQLLAAGQIQEDHNVNNLFTDCIMNIVKGSVTEMWKHWTQNWLIPG